jgi:endoglucanase
MRGIAVITGVAALLVSLTHAAAAEQPSYAGNPIAMTTGLFVDPDSVPNIWVRSHTTDPRAARIKAAMGARPIAKWFGNWSGDVTAAASAYVAKAAAVKKLPVLVAYNLPDRDACGGHSGGGAGTPAAYRTWISALAAGIGARPALVIIEPDAFGDYDCMDPAAAATRNALLIWANQQLLAKAPNTWAYLDAGNAGWVKPDVMAARLHAAGLPNVHGFAVNVSNYYTTAQSANYAAQVNTHLLGRGYVKPFVVDTSRNGNGHGDGWCNPPGRRLGTPPRIGGGAELLLWVKTVGTSDGLCGTAPTVPAGTFDPALAIRLIDGV